MNVFMSLFVLARGTLNFLFRLKLSSQLFWGGRSLYSLWSELQVMESRSLVVIDCLRWESVSKLAWKGKGRQKKFLNNVFYCNFTFTNLTAPLIFVRILSCRKRRLRWPRSPCHRPRCRRTKALHPYYKRASKAQEIDCNER